MFSLLCVGIMIVNIILDSFQQAEKEKYDLELRRTQNETILSIETGIDVYKTLVSGLRSFLKNSPEFPTEKELHYFLHDLVKDTEFTDSIVVSWVDTNQIFRYAVTPRQIDPFQLKGATVKNIRPKHEIKHLDRLMNQPAIELFPPINLIEGWAAFPFNFSVKNKNGVVIGYIAPVVNVKYLLNKLYQNSGNKDYVYQFSVNDSIILIEKKYLMVQNATTKRLIMKILKIINLIH